MSSMANEHLLKDEQLMEGGSANVIAANPGIVAVPMGNADLLNTFETLNYEDEDIVQQRQYPRS